jgi:hypothetical protein
VNIHLQLSAPVVGQVWLVTVVMFAKILIAIVVLIVLLDDVAQFSMLNQQMVMLLNAISSILIFLRVLTKTASRSRLWSNVNLEMNLELFVFVMWSYHAAPLGRAVLFLLRLIRNSIFVSIVFDVSSLIKRSSNLIHVPRMMLSVNSDIIMS